MPRLLPFIAACLALLAASCANLQESPAETSAATAPAVPTILISIDGFRADYLDRGVTPNIAALAAGGVRARAMRPSFPSLTFPNHYALVTGLRPDRHGIVNNTMEDPRIPGVTFKLSNRQAVEDRRWWDDAEPIWVTAERAGIRTATMFWPGSEAPIRGIRPTDWVTFDDKLPNEARVDRVLGWFDRPADRRPVFATLYFSEVDHVGHAAGPDASATNDALANVDRAIGRLLTGLEDRNMTGQVNLVVVSDHGMAGTSPDRVVRLDRIADSMSFRAVSVGAVAGIEPQPGRRAAVERALLSKHPHASCWRKGEIPKRLVYGTHRRVPSIVCLADTGWLVLAGPSTYSSTAGAHGYDPSAPEMAALFVANGPAFRRGALLPEIHNTDVYPLLAKLIGIEPRANDGRPEALRAALR